jgi:hypothetical protein
MGIGGGDNFVKISIMGKGVLLLVVVSLFLTYLFLFPKLSSDWDVYEGWDIHEGYKGTSMWCDCLGVKKPLGSGFGASPTLCFGIPHSCEYDPRYAVPFLWFAGYSLLALSVASFLLIKERIGKKAFLLILLGALLLWFIFRIVLALCNVVSGGGTLDLDEFWNIASHALMPPLDALLGLYLFFP